MIEPGNLRSRAWFDNSSDPEMTALYLSWYLNYGLTREELQSGKPISGIAQTGSDLAPCNRHHLELAKRVREGIREAGGIAIEFPVYSIHETSKRPTSGLDRNLAYLSLVESLYGYLSSPADPEAFEGTAFVFDGPEDYHSRINDVDLGITDRDILVMRGAEPIEFPGAAEVVNMQPPDYLIPAGVHALPCIGDGRQSGTSGSPSILNASPEAAAGGNLALLRTGD